ncbi:MAG: hypothetical protein RR795_01570 [Cetobacterium sp.]|uniref:hypothetical protein n=1 Tax=Cetobacterium sp. TaxID=2071632 RepID=UPI002FC83012
MGKLLNKEMTLSQLDCEMSMLGHGEEVCWMSEECLQDCIIFGVIFYLDIESGEQTRIVFETVTQASDSESLSSTMIKIKGVY